MLKKINVITDKVKSKLGFDYGKKKLALYLAWPSIVNAEILEKSTIKSIAYDQNNNLIAKVVCQNKSFGAKLHYMLPQIEQKASVAAKATVNIVIV